MFSLNLEYGAGFEKRLDAVLSVLSADAGISKFRPTAPAVSSHPPVRNRRPRGASGEVGAENGCVQAYLESLAIAIASSSVSEAMTLNTGPKISSRAIVMSFFTLTNTVGLTK